MERMEFVDKTESMLLTLNTERMLVLEKILIHAMKEPMLSVLSADAKERTHNVDKTEYFDILE